MVLLEEIEVRLRFIYGMLVHVRQADNGYLCVLNAFSSSIRLSTSSTTLLSYTSSVLCLPSTPPAHA